MFFPAFYSHRVKAENVYNPKTFMDVCVRITMEPP